MVLAVTMEQVPLDTDAHGVVRLAGTRVTLEIIVDAFNAGASPEEIVLSYPSLQLADVYAVIAYYLRHKAEVDSYLEAEERAAAEARERLRRQRGLPATARAPSRARDLWPRRLILEKAGMLDWLMKRQLQLTAVIERQRGGSFAPVSRCPDSSGAGPPSAHCSRRSRTGPASTFTRNKP
jgi:uncharacterized protein (DUF433 family)